ncbi:glyoxalase superfamily protein [Pseudomonas asiatica]|uniref:glyoxalase superfamily protein n=1 Tax=Pseudomonas asiatica TaxID=2219225 RepID=UPI0010BF8016|nr:glyoxalase superfamily protein [Pseudomonas asiatica]EKT4529994.1 hypothetical protein [Pseudomonas putida]
MQTVAQFKKRADRLRTYLQGHGLKVTRAASLEAQAAQEGFCDWNTLSALAKAELKPTLAKALRPGLVSGKPVLAEYIGSDLPTKPSSRLQAELDDLELAIKEGALHTRFWKDMAPSRWSGAWCCSMAMDVPNDFKCRLCGNTLPLESYNFFKPMMETLSSFHALRWLFSRALKRSVLGLEAYVPFGHQPSILEIVCREQANEIIHTAAKDFGLDPYLRNALSSNDRVPGSELGLGYYPDVQTLTTALGRYGISSAQADSLGWLTSAVSKTDRPFGLVVTFLNDASGGPASFWGYRPKSLRARRGEGSEPYVVGMDYPRDTVYLSHLINDKPLVLVTGFMHAIALRDRGVNAVAVPYLDSMSKAAVELVMQGGGKVVLSASKSTRNAESSGPVILRAEHRKRLALMNELDSYEGPEGFLIERFLEDMTAALADKSDS